MNITDYAKNCLVKALEKPENRAKLLESVKNQKYQVKITNTESGETDTQIVKACREGMAKTEAMHQTKLKFSGQLVNFEITKI